MSLQLRTLLLQKTPIVHRCFVATALLALSAPESRAQPAPAPLAQHAPAAQPAPTVQALTERDAVGRVLERAPMRDAVEGDATAEEGRARAASALPNPELSYVREQTFGAAGTGEDYLSIAQVIDLGGRRSSAGEAGELRARAVRREGEATRLATAAEARRRFFEVLYRQERLVALEGWVIRIDGVLAIVRRRERSGDAAAYDLRRLERERTVAATRVEVERAALEGAGARLAALLGAPTGEAEPRVVGALLPTDEPAALPELRGASASRPELAALELRAEAAEVAGSAASRWWAPDLRLEGGWKGIDLGAAGRTDGFFLGASLALPVWDRSTGLARVAEGEARGARARRELVGRELDGELGGARAEAVRLRRAAGALREASAATSADLVRIVTAGYEGGELGLLELLDAYRGAVDDALGVHDLEHAARRARIELDRQTGARLP